jgi:aspartate/methionine/tyrosine aminotransferase
MSFHHLIYYVWENLKLGYTESPGLPLLREEISRLYSAVDQDRILTTAGAEEGIYCTMRALLSTGDHVIGFSPCYQSLMTVPSACGADVTTIALKCENQWRVDIEQVKRAFRPSTKLVVLNCPHNPTGALLDEGAYNAIIDLARERGSYIFSDEVYRYLEIDEPQASACNSGCL